MNSHAYLLDRHLEEGHGDRIALRSEDRQLTYRELRELSARAAQMFANQGMAHGDRVALLLPDDPYFVTALFGLLRIGIVPVPLNQRLSTRDLVRIVDDCRPRGAVVSPPHAPRLAGIAGEVPPERVWVTGEVDAVPYGMRSFDADLASTPPRMAADPVTDEDPALVLYTSGTTGAPKGVVHVHRGLSACHFGCFAPPFAVTTDDLCVSTASLSFAYGLYALLHALAVGATVLLDNAPRMPHLILERLQSYSPSVVFSTPRLYTDIVAIAEGHPGIEVPRLRLCVSSGEPVPMPLFARWRRRFGHELLDVVGATETLRPFLVPDPRHKQPERSRQPSPECELELRDERGRSVPATAPGQLFVRMACNAAGYWERESEAAASIVGDWVRTGDVAVRDAAGGYELLGRIDGIAKVRGQKVVAGEIESCLHEHEAVLDCALVIATGADELATTVAFVEADSDGNGDGELPRTLRRHCRRRLAPHKVPARIEIVEALPRTPNGKIARGELRESATEQLREEHREYEARPVAAEEQHAG